MEPKGRRERRREHSRDEEFRRIATRSLREGVSVDELDLGLKNPDGSAGGPDAGRVDELRIGAKRELLAMAGLTPEQVAIVLKAAKEGVEAPASAAPRAPRAPEKTLTAEQRATLFATLEARFTSDTKRYEGIEWPVVQRSLEAAGEKTLYALFKLEENGHEVGVVAMEKGGKQGFQFDSCSRFSPKGIRDIDYFKAAKIVKEWSSDGTVDLDLMDPQLFEKLRQAGIITNNGTWDHLKTEDPGTPEKPGLAWFGLDRGVSRAVADDHSHLGGFRCSLWVPAA